MQNIKVTVGQFLNTPVYGSSIPTQGPITVRDIVAAPGVQGAVSGCAVGAGTTALAAGGASLIGGQKSARSGSLPAA